MMREEPDNCMFITTATLVPFGTGILGTFGGTIAGGIAHSIWPSVNIWIGAGIGAGIGAAIPILVVAGVYMKNACADAKDIGDETTTCEKLSHCWSRLFSKSTTELQANLDDSYSEGEYEDLRNSL